MIQPEQIDIDIAEKLQSLGLCQGAKEWIRKHPMLGIHSGGRSKPESNWEEVGPKPTAQECWPEMLRCNCQLLDMVSVNQCFNMVSKIMEEKELKEDVDQAFALALIALAKG
jgi:hypothetical protein